MARLLVEDGGLVLRLSWSERLRARRGTIRLPWTVVEAARIEPDWWRTLRGTPVKGSHRPAHCLGERRHPAGRDFVAVRSGGPAVLVGLRPGAPFARIAVTVPQAEAEETVRAVRRHRTPHR
ncbi:hypothetical protein [Streptomyces sp. NPDC127190]|uniref:hypothetical protein n=1 Tax=unclassified Streptomyces TaxID=2593676 RepID=UPI0036340130